MHFAAQAVAADAGTATCQTDSHMQNKFNISQYAMLADIALFVV